MHDLWLAGVTCSHGSFKLRLLGQVFLLRWNGIDALKIAIRIVLYLVVSVSGMYGGTEGGKVVGGRIDMQCEVLVQALRSGQQILTKLVAEVHVYLLKCAFAMHEGMEMLVHMLPFTVLVVGEPFEVGKEVALHHLLVKEVVASVDNMAVSLAQDAFSLLCEELVVVALHLILWLGINVDAERLMADGLHGDLVAQVWIIVEIEGKHCPVLDFALA